MNWIMGMEKENLANLDRLQEKLKMKDRKILVKKLMYIKGIIDEVEAKKLNWKMIFIKIIGIIFILNFNYSFKGSCIGLFCGWKLFNNKKYDKYHWSSSIPLFINMYGMNGIWMKGPSEFMLLPDMGPNGG